MSRREIEQDVAAQDDVEPAGMRRRIDQVADVEADRGAQLARNAPVAAASSSNQRIICITGRPRWISNWE